VSTAPEAVGAPDWRNIHTHDVPVSKLDYAQKGVVSQIVGDYVSGKRERPGRQSSSTTGDQQVSRSRRHAPSYCRPDAWQEGDHCHVIYDRPWHHRVFGIKDTRARDLTRTLPRSWKPMASIPQLRHPRRPPPIPWWRGCSRALRRVRALKAKSSRGHEVERKAGAASASLSYTRAFRDALPEFRARPGRRVPSHAPGDIPVRFSDACSKAPTSCTAATTRSSGWWRWRCASGKRRRGSRLPRGRPRVREYGREFGEVAAGLYTPNE